MPLLDVDAFGEVWKGLPRSARILGLDVSKRRIGLAIMDRDVQLPTPLGVIQRTRLKADLKVLGTTLLDRGVQGMIIGLPLNMSGEEGPRCQSVRSFASQLLKAYKLPVCLWDERLTTAQAEWTLEEIAQERRAEALDQMAAVYILQGFLEHIENP